jgi:hypothetical protein
LGIMAGTFSEQEMMPPDFEIPGAPGGDA